jgi:hypothetical protein
VKGQLPCCSQKFSLCNPGCATLGNPAAAFRIQTPILDQQFLDSLSWSRGRHAFKFSAEYRAGANDEIPDRSSAGLFAISPLITSLPGVANTGNALASFLLGEVNAASVQVSDKIRTPHVRLTGRSIFRMTGV